MEFDLGEILTAAASEAALSPTQLAASVGKTEGAARQWLAGRAEIGARDLIALMALMPGLRKRVFDLVRDLEAVA